MRNGPVLTATFLLLLPSLAFAISQYDVEAAFLLNFTRFVDWPQTSAGGGEGRFTVCVIGTDPFGNHLEQVFAHQQVKQRRPELVRLSEEAASPRCQIAYVATRDPERAAGVLRKFKGAPTLTVGEAPGFARTGGIIQFTVQDERVRFVINLQTARQAGLQISSKLLAIAEVIR